MVARPNISLDQPSPASAQNTDLPPTLSLLDALHRLSLPPPSPASSSAGDVVPTFPVATAISAIVFHAGSSPDDLSYTLRRLCGGLTSGSSSVRVGFASALSSLLASSSVESVPASRMREILVRETTPEKKSAARTVRHYNLGRIFGILAAVRGGRACSVDDQTVWEGHVEDILRLFDRAVHFMEPCGHALCELYGAATNRVAAEDFLRKKFLDLTAESEWTAEHFAVQCAILSTTMTAEELRRQTPALMATVSRPGGTQRRQYHAGWGAVVSAARKDVEVAFVLAGQVVTGALAREGPDWKGRRKLVAALLGDVLQGTVGEDVVRALLQPEAVGAMLAGAVGDKTDPLGVLKSWTGLQAVSAAVSLIGSGCAVHCGGAVVEVIRVLERKFLALEEEEHQASAYIDALLIRATATPKKQEGGDEDDAAASRCIDALASFAKKLKCEAVIQKALYGLATVAFFEMSQVFEDEDAKKEKDSSKKKKKKKKQQKDGELLMKLREKKMMHTALLLRSSSAPIPSPHLRRVATARILSLLSVLSSRRADRRLPPHVASAMWLSSLLEMWNVMERHGVSPSTPLSDEAVAAAGPTRAEAINAVTSEGYKKVSPTSVMRMALALQFLCLPGDASEQGGGMDEETAIEYIEGAMDDGEGSHMASIAEIVVALHSVEELGNDDLSASSSRMLREISGGVWMGILQGVGGINATSVVDEEVVSILLEVVCENSSNNNDDDDDAMEEDNYDENDDNEENEDEDIPINVCDRDVTSTDSTTKSPTVIAEDSDYAEDDGPFVSTDRLKDLLDDDGSISADDLMMHHEGADAALVKMIALRQENRKAGQAALAQSDMRRRLRVASLLEQCMTKGRAISSKAVLTCLVPLLQTRRAIEGELNKKRDFGEGIASTKAMLEKVTIILLGLGKKKAVLIPSEKNKEEDEEDIDNSKKDAAIAAVTMTEIWEETYKSKSMQQCTCCSSALVAAAKQSESKGESLSPPVLELYARAVEEWSCKRTKLHTVLFEDLIRRILPCHPKSSPSVILWLSTALGKGRTPFIKTETVRLLNVLLSDKLLSDEVTTLPTAPASLADNLAKALTDEHFQIAQRSRELLRTCKTAVGTGILVFPKDDGPHTRLKGALTVFRDNHKNVGGVHKICDDILQKMEEVHTTNKGKHVESAMAAETEKAEKATAVVKSFSMRKDSKETNYDNTVIEIDVSNSTTSEQGGKKNKSKSPPPSKSKKAKKKKKQRNNFNI